MFNLKTEKVYIFVTNDLNQDQRMHKIAQFLYLNGYRVLLIGREKKNSPNTLIKPYDQYRFPCVFQQGPIFYLEYNIRMILFLLFKERGIIYAVDVDTVLGATCCRFMKKTPVIFDAHEWFAETPELDNRTWVKKIWNLVAQWGIPKANVHFTVNQSLADIFSKQYKVVFTPVYNVPSLEKFSPSPMHTRVPFILIYQGVLNKGRGLEEIILAMTSLSDVKLFIVGEGDLSLELRNMAARSEAADRIIFTGWLFGEDLVEVTKNAHLGLNLLVTGSKSYYYSLANKFFDYLYAGVPSLNMDYPEYSQILERYPVGKTISTLSPEVIRDAVSVIKNDAHLFQSMKQACFDAVREYHWEKEEKKLRQALISASLL